jgi:hypothetical protein
MTSAFSLVSTGMTSLRAIFLPMEVFATASLFIKPLRLSGVPRTISMIPLPDSAARKIARLDLHYFSIR